MSGEVRSVEVRLSANTRGYQEGMGKADAATASVERSLGRLQKKSLSTDQVMSKVGKGGKLLFLGAAGGIAVAEKKAADFNAEMATVQTLSHANTRQMDLLSRAAKTVGVNIGYSATQSADAEEELIKAGVKLKDILGGGLKGALDLAAAGQTDVGTATEVAASAMTQFKLKGKDVPHIADLLAAGADKALGSVSDLGYGLSQVGTQAHQMGFSIEDTVGTLAEFAQSGLIGEKGGSTLKQMFLQLAAPTDKAADLMKKYNLSLYDNKGQIKSMPELTANLQKSFKDLDPASRNAALGIIFGSRAIQGANILIADGEKKNRKWIKAVNDQGFAAHQASGKMNSLKGDLSKLNAIAGNVLIGQGGKQGFLRGAVQDATKLLKRYDQLSDAQKNLVTKGFVKAAAVGGLLWTASKVYSLAKGTAEFYRGAGKFLGRGASATAASTLGKESASAVGSRVFVTNWPPGFGVGGGPGGGPGGEPGVVSTAEKTSKLGKVVNFGLNVATVIAAAKAMDSLNSAIARLGDKGNEKGPLKDFKKPKTTRDNLLFGSGHTLKNDTHAALGATKFGGVGAGIDQGLAKLVGGDALTKSLKNVKALDTALARLNYKDPTKGAQAYADVLKKSGLTQDQLNKILPKTAREMQGLDSATGNVGNVLGQTTTNVKDYQRKLLTLPKDVRTKITAPGFKPTSDNIRQLKHQYDLTPRQIRTLVKLLGGPAVIGAANAVNARLNALQGKTIRTYIKNITQDIHQKAPKKGGIGALLGAGGSADGSTVPGPRSPYGDKVLMPVAPGEEIISNRRGQADKWRPVLKAINKGMADGGTVGSAVSGGTGTTGVSVVFPAPSILKASVTAANQIAVSAAKTALSAKDTRAAHLDDLHQRQQIRDLERGLREKETVGKKGHRHKRLVERGLDRTTAKAELADAKATLDRLRKGYDAIDALKADRATANDTLQGKARTTVANPLTAVRNVQKDIADLSAFGTVLARLKAAKASPALLAYVQRQADDGDWRSATRLGNALLNQPAVMGQLSASLGDFSHVASNVATLTTDPRFASTKAWNPTGTTSTVQVLVQVDPSAQTAEITRQVTHAVTQAIAGP